MPLPTLPKFPNQISTLASGAASLRSAATNAGQFAKNPIDGILRFLSPAPQEQPSGTGKKGMFTIDTFTGYARNDGFSPANRFEVLIPCPPSQSYKLWHDSLIEKHLFIKSVEMPGVNVSSSPHRIYGEVFEGPYDRNFGPLTVTFMMDRDHRIRYLFEDWINQIQDPSTRAMRYYDDYTVYDMIVNVLDKNDYVVQSTQFFTCFPKSLGNISLDQSNSSFVTFDVTFEYRYYQIKESTYVGSSATSEKMGVDTGDGMSILDVAQAGLSAYQDAKLTYNTAKNGISDLKKFF